VEGKNFSLTRKKIIFLSMEGNFLIEEVIGYLIGALIIRHYHNGLVALAQGYFHMGAPGHKYKLFSLSGVNAFGLPNNWFWRVGLVTQRFYCLEASPNDFSLERFLRL
jgi:hypothetical protein